MNLINQTVVHKAFGEGTIVAYDGNYITVKFSAKESKFVVPDVFTTFLKCKDAKLQAELEAAFVAKEEVKAQKAREAREQALREAEETKRLEEEITKRSEPKSSTRSRTIASSTAKNARINKNYKMVAQIEQTLRSVRPDYADEISGINNIRAQLSSGGKLSLEDHVKAMILALLSNMQKWHKIESHMDEINSIFCNYRVSDLLDADENMILKRITSDEIKCGNLSIGSQVRHLKDNIRILKRIDEENEGGIDAFYAQIDKYSLVDMLSNYESEYKLQDMGVALVCEYLKGVGISLVKPDTHVRRIIGRLGFTEKIPADDIETLHICDEIAEEMELTHPLLDTILWQYCVKEKCGICTETPACARCGVTLCPNRK